MRSLRLATRSSAQARRQSEMVADALRWAHRDLAVELVFVESLGDRRRDVPLHQLGGQGIFVKEVQQAVLDGRADIAVHSAKDLPSQTAPGLELAAFTERRDARDALIGQPLAELPEGGTVATGSIRRRTQLQVLRPDLHFVELRGNIPTRLEKVPPGGALVMALAALQVLERTGEVAEVLTVEQMVPMVGQGCVAVECRQGDTAVRELVTVIDHPATRAAVTVERAFLAELGGGCTMPVGAHVDGEHLHTFLALEGAEVPQVVRDEIPLPGGPDVERDLAVAASAARRSAEVLSG